MHTFDRVDVGLAVALLALALSVYNYVNVTASNDCLGIDVTGANSLVYIGQVSCGDKAKNTTPDNVMNNSIGDEDVDKYLEKIQENIDAIPIDGIKDRPDVIGVKPPDPGQ